MSHHRTIEQTVFSILPIDIGGLKVLDVGMGEGLWGFILKTQKNGKFHLTGVEPFIDHIFNLKKVHIYDELYPMKGQQYFEFYPEAKFDIILLLEVIEHDTKEESIKLIKSLEKRMNHGGLMIVSTPDGFSEGAKGYAGNDANKHMSGWSRTELQDLGYITQSIRKDVNWGRVPNWFASIWYMLRLHRMPVTRSLIAWKHQIAVKS